MSFNIRDYVSDDHIESIGEIATGQARIIQALSLDNSQKDKEIERLNNIINEQDKELELERKSRQLLTDDLANVCEMSLKKDNIINKAIEYIEDYQEVLKDHNGDWLNYQDGFKPYLLALLEGADKE